jgi:hypothetical protein
MSCREKRQRNGDGGSRRSRHEETAAPCASAAAFGGAAYPAADRLWVDAMRGDLDVAHAEGRALSWAFGALIAAGHFRAAAMAALTARRRRALSLLMVIVICASIGLLTYRAINGAWPFHSAAGYLLYFVPIIVLGALAFWGADRVTVIDDRWVRRSLLALSIVFGLTALSVTLFVAGRALRGITEVLYGAPLLFTVLRRCGNGRHGNGCDVTVYQLPQHPTPHTAVRLLLGC